MQSSSNFSDSGFHAPFKKFETWFAEACANKNIIEPTAMCLATANSSGAPSARMVLLKNFDERGFCFFTNLTSRKATELSQNQQVALCFYWGILGKQVRIEGKVEAVSKAEADDYFASRRRESRIGAWASKQSQPMQNWQEFESRIAEIEKKFEGTDVPRPDFWSGFRVVPQKIEFWQEGEFRIHTREVFERVAGEIGKMKETGRDYSCSWAVKQIYP